MALALEPLAATTLSPRFGGAAVVALAQTTGDTTASALGLNIDEILADSDKPLFIRYGIFGGATFNNHTANFTDFANFINEPSPLRGGFGSSNGSFSYYFGAMLEYPIASRFGFGLRASYSNLGNFSLSGLENQLTASPTPSQTPFLLRITHSLEVERMNMLAGEPYLTYRLLDALTIKAGARFGYFLSTNYRIRESIPEDSPVRFVAQDGTQTTEWNSRSGEIPELNPLHISLLGGISYEIPLDAGGKWLLAFEGMYLYGGFSQVANNLILRRPADEYNGLLATRTPPDNELGTDRDPRSMAWPSEETLGSWTLDNIRAGASLRYSPFRTIRPELTPQLQETFKTIKKIDSVIAAERVQNQKQLARVDSVNKEISKRVEELKKVGISVNITKVVGVDASGKEIPGKPKLVVEQFRKSVTQPLLPAIFFDESSFTIPSKYRRLRAADRATFKMGDLAGKSNYEIYRHILNIIGKRMEENPAAVLFVTGCNANVGAEQGNQKLSEQRAQAVSDYLQDVWKIPAKRIIVQKRDLPEQASNSATPEGAAENRRVDLSSTLPEILAPVTSDIIAKIPNPPTLRFGLEINAGAGLKQWNFEVTQFAGDEVETVFQRTGTNSYPQQLDWNLAQDGATVPGSGQDLTVQLTMTDINNKTGDAPLMSIPVEQINVQKKELENKGDKRIDWFDLIGFAGGATPTLDDAAQATLEAIKAKIKPNATVTVSAYTDNTGDEAQNRQIAQKRAEFIAQSLGLTTLAINAAGPTAIHDNNTPEGRMYNRFVRVEIVSPTK
jgi:outer membrane protein OmpA-like peptidoglycan-associated protein